MTKETLSKPGNEFLTFNPTNFYEQMKQSILDPQNHQQYHPSIQAVFENEGRATSTPRDDRLIELLFYLKRLYHPNQRLAIQQHDILPLLAHHALQIEEAYQSNITPLNEAEVGKVLSKIIADPPTHITHEGIDQKTLATIQLLGQTWAWMSEKVLNPAANRPLYTIVNDPWKLARIAFSTYFRESFVDTLIDGTEGQLEVTTLLLLHHAAYTGVRYENLDDVLNTIKQPEFLRTLEHLTPAANGFVLPGLRNGDFKKRHFTDNLTYPVLSRQGRQFLRQSLVHQKKQKRVYDQFSPISPDISQMPQKVCPAIMRSFKLTPTQPGKLPSPGISTPEYLDTVREIATTNPNTFEVNETNTALHVEVKRSPIQILHETFIHYLEELSTHQY